MLVDFFSGNAAEIDNFPGVEHGFAASSRTRLRHRPGRW
jgi:hypothetical protein